VEGMGSARNVDDGGAPLALDLSPGAALGPGVLGERGPDGTAVAGNAELKQLPVAGVAAGADDPAVLRVVGEEEPVLEPETAPVVAGGAAVDERTAGTGVADGNKAIAGLGGAAVAVAGAEEGGIGYAAGAAVLAIDLRGIGERVDRDREASLVLVVAEDGPMALEEVDISRLCRGGRRGKYNQEQGRPGYEPNPVSTRSAAVNSSVRSIPVSRLTWPRSPRGAPSPRPPRRAPTSRTRMRSPRAAPERAARRTGPCSPRRSRVPGSPGRAPSGR
jgi:hypothetical protein